MKPIKAPSKRGFVINCAGLHSDRIAKLGNVDPGAKIVPFRGEYYELTPEKRYLVKGLIYPVPNPDFPFLGVHFTRMIDGTVHAGPNAVLSLKREGYQKTDFDLRDFAEVMTYPAFWKLAARHADEGIKEIIRSFSQSCFCPKPATPDSRSAGGRCGAHSCGCARPGTHERWQVG